MRKSLDVVALVVLILAFSMTMSCDQPGGSSATGVPEPPNQAVVEEYGADQQRADNALNELASIKNSIQEARDQWRQTPAPVGPEFNKEADTLAQEIRTKCDDLESQATSLLEEPFVLNHKGAPDTIKEYLKFARAIRAEVDGNEGTPEAP